MQRQSTQEYGDGKRSAKQQDGQKAQKGHLAPQTCFCGRRTTDRDNCCTSPWQIEERTTLTIFAGCSAMHHGFV
jgi:hypothetical protein